MTEPQVEAPESAACRVAWEVAGVRGDLKKKVGTFTEAGKKGKINAYNWMYEMEIYKMEDTWPEQDRKRVWVSLPSFLSNHQSTDLNLLIVRCSTEFLLGFIRRRFACHS